jgi:hypothetical protein
MREYTLISPITPQEPNLGSVEFWGRPARVCRAITIVDYVAKLYGQINAN